jgi:hypothetical protein
MSRASTGRAMSDGLRPFNASGYEILDSRLASHGEVVIWSTHPQAPDLGDNFTLEPDGILFDVIVVESTSVPGGGWIARCQRTGARPNIFRAEIAS